MGKERHQNFELPLSGKTPPVRRKTTIARARSSRSRLLLLDYQIWLTIMATVPAAAAATSQPDRSAPS